MVFYEIPSLHQPTPRRMMVRGDALPHLTSPHHAQGSLAMNLPTHAAVFDEMAVHAARSREATATGAQAFARLLALAEQHDSGQSIRVTKFIAATYNGRAFPFDVFEMRAVDIAISDDMLVCLDALRWAKADLHTLVPEGDVRVRRLIRHAGLRWPSQG